MELIIEVDEKYYEACKDAVKESYPSQIEEVIANGIPYNPTGDLISREALIKAVEQGEGVSWDNHGKDDLCVRKKYIDSATAVVPERPQGDCEKCDYRKFTEKFIDGFVDALNKYGITSIEQLSEILKGGEKQ